MQGWKIDAFIMAGLDEASPKYEDEIDEEELDYLKDLEFDNFREED